MKNFKTFINLNEDLDDFWRGWQPWDRFPRVPPPPPPLPGPPYGPPPPRPPTLPPGFDYIPVEPIYPESPGDGPIGGPRRPIIEPKPPYRRPPWGLINPEGVGNTDPTNRYWKYIKDWVKNPSNPRIPPPPPGWTGTIIEWTRLVIILYPWLVFTQNAGGNNDAPPGWSGNPSQGYNPLYPPDGWTLTDIEWYRDLLGIDPKYFPSYGLYFDENGNLIDQQNWGPRPPGWVGPWPPSGNGPQPNTPIQIVDDLPLYSM